MTRNRDVWKNFREVYLQFGEKTANDDDCNEKRQHKNNNINRFTK